MGRVALGSAARSQIVSVRLTPAEVEELKRKYGTAAKGIRALVAANLKEKQ